MFNWFRGRSKRTEITGSENKVEQSLKVIPRDIWHNIIFPYLEKQDIKNLRLTCYWFRTYIVTEPVFSSWISIKHFQEARDNYLRLKWPIELHCYFPYDTNEELQNIKNLPSSCGLLGLDLSLLIVDNKTLKLLPSSLRIVVLPAHNNITDTGYFHLIKEYPNLDVQILDSLGKKCSLLFWASSNGRLKVVKYLLEEKKQVQNVNHLNGYYHQTALYVASFRGDVEIVRLLLNAGANPCQVSDNFGDFPLLVSCKQGHRKVVQMLLEKGGNVYQKNNWGKSPADYINLPEISEYLTNNRKPSN